MRDAVTSIKQEINGVGEKVDRGFQVRVQQICCLRFDHRFEEDFSNPMRN
jgi:hypothetical protein